ncbi:phosphoprotein [Hayes Yard virus]|uniref:Phosphoprotein n=1 Tax=Hayes Yard virus TaxID=2602440 RepID=A0A7D0MS58_9RHAB|nr:phosphoprotein [Hayes Yard virus]QEA08651.1 phosphoprotein [Hayes Yard virus]
MESFKTNGFVTNYDLERLKNNLQDDSLNEDEETIFVKAQGEEIEKVNNPIVGLPEDAFLLNREISLEEFETGASGNWEDDVLKIVELAESPHIPLFNMKTECNRTDEERPNRYVPRREEECVSQLGIHDVQKVTQALNLFGLKEHKDYVLEGNENGYITLRKLLRDREGIKKEKHGDPQKTTDSLTHDGDTTFDKIMNALKLGIRIKKKIGRGFVKINVENFPMTHHEIHAWSLTQKGGFQTMEESVQCLFKKSKQLRGLSKGLDLENIIILE